MIKDGKFRFTLQFGMNTDEEQRAGNLLEQLGKKKSPVVLKTIIQCEINEDLYSSAQRHAITGLEIEPYDVDFKVASVVCMYAMNNRSLADNYYRNIEGELTNRQKECIAAFKNQN